MHVIDYNEEGLRGVADTVITLSKSEGLPAHGEAISARINAEEG